LNNRYKHGLSWSVDLLQFGLSQFRTLRADNRCCITAFARFP